MTFPSNAVEIEKLKQLDEDERNAFLDLLVLAILADAKITEEELELLDKELLVLPFLLDDDMKKKAEKRIQSAKTYLEKNIHDHDLIHRFIHELSFHLIDPTVRYSALRMFITLTMVDGTTELERDRAVYLAQCFGWSESRVDEIQTMLGA